MTSYIHVHQEIHNQNPETVTAIATNSSIALVPKYVTDNVVVLEKVYKQTLVPAR